MATEDFENFRKILMLKPKEVTSEQLNYFKEALQKEKKFRTQARCYIQKPSDEINKKCLTLFIEYLQDEITGHGKVANEHMALSVESDVFIEELMPKASEAGLKVNLGMSLWALYLRKRFKELKKISNSPEYAGRTLGFACKKIYLNYVRFGFERLKWKKSLEKTTEIFIWKISMLVYSAKKRIMHNSFICILEVALEEKSSVFVATLRMKHEKYVLKLYYERMINAFYLKKVLTFMYLKNYIPPGYAYEYHVQEYKTIEIFRDERISDYRGEPLGENEKDLGRLENNQYLLEIPEGDQEKTQIVSEKGSESSSSESNKMTLLRGLFIRKNLRDRAELKLFFNRFKMNQIMSEKYATHMKHLSEIDIESKTNRLKRLKRLFNKINKQEISELQKCFNSFKALCSVPHKRLSIFSDSLESETAKILKRAMKVFYQYFKQPLHHWKLLVIDFKTKKRNITNLVRVITGVINEKNKFIFQIYKYYSRKINFVKSFCRIFKSQEKIQLKTVLNTWRFAVFQGRFVIKDQDFIGFEGNDQNYLLANGICEEIQEFTEMFDGKIELKATGNINDQKIELILVKLGKTMRKRANGLMHLSVQKLKLNANAIILLKKIEFFKRILECYKEKVRIGFEKIGPEAQKIVKVMAKKGQKALRSTKSKQTKTQRVTKIFYKYFGKRLEKWKNLAKLKKTISENALKIMKKMIVAKYQRMIKNFVHVAQENQLKIKSLKFLSKLAAKVLHLAMHRWVINGNSYKSKMSEIFSKAEQRYRQLTLESFKKLEKNGKKVQNSLQKKKTKILRSGNNKRKNYTVTLQKIFNKFFAKWIRKWYDKINILQNTGKSSAAKVKLLKKSVQILGKNMRKVLKICFLKWANYNHAYKNKVKGVVSKLGEKYILLVKSVFNQVRMTVKSINEKKVKNKSNKTLGVKRIFEKCFRILFLRWLKNAKSQTAVQGKNVKNKTKSVVLIEKLLGKIALKKQRGLFAKWGKYTKMFRIKMKFLLDKAKTRYFILLQESLRRLRLKNQKISMMKKKQTKILRSGKKVQQVEKTIGVKNIFYKCFRMQFYKLKDFSVMKSRKIQTSEITKRMQASSLKSLFRIIGKIVSTAYSRWKNYSKTFRNKLSLLMAKAMGRYKILTQKSFEKLRQRVSSKKIMIKKKETAILRSGKIKESKKANIRYIFNRFLSLWLKQWLIKANLVLRNQQCKRLMTKAIRIFSENTRNRLTCALRKLEKYSKNFRSTVKLAISKSQARYFALKKSVLLAMQLKNPNRKINILRPGLAKKSNFSNFKLIFYKFFRRHFITLKTNCLKANISQKSLTKAKANKVQNISKLLKTLFKRTLHNIFRHFINIPSKSPQKSLRFLNTIFQKYLKSAFTKFKIAPNLTKLLKKSQNFTMAKYKLNSFLIKIITKKINSTNNGKKKLIHTFSLMKNHTNFIMQKALNCFVSVTALKNKKAYGEKHLQMRILSITKNFYQGLRERIAKWRTISQKKMVQNGCKNAILSKILKEISYRTINQSFCMIGRKNIKKYPGNLARVIDKYCNQRLLKRKFVEWHKNYVIECIKLNNNLWKMKLNKTKTQQELEFSKKIHKFSKIQSINAIFRTYQSSLKTFALQKLLKSHELSSSKPKNFKIALKKLKITYLSSTKRAFDKWNSQIKWIVSTLMINYSQGISTIIQSYLSFQLKKKSNSFHTWKNCKFQVFGKRSACSQMHSFRAKLDEKFRLFILYKNFSRWVLEKSTKIPDSDLLALQNELEITRLKASSYCAELVKLKNYNSFLYKKINHK